MIKQPLHSPSIKEIEQYILPEETVRAMKTAIAHQKTQIEYFSTIMEAQALFGCVRPTKTEPTPTKHEATTRDQTKQQPKQDASKQEMEFMKPILIGGLILAVIFLAYFFAHILLVA